MLKHLLRKLVDSVLHSRRSRRGYGSSRRPGYGYRGSSSSRYGPSHRRQGHSYYKNKYRGSSS